MENGLPGLKSGLSLHFFQELGLCSMLVYLLKESTAKKKNEGAEKLKTKNEQRQGSSATPSAPNILPSSQKAPQLRVVR